MNVGELTHRNPLSECVFTRACVLSVSPAPTFWSSHSGLPVLPRAEPFYWVLYSATLSPLVSRISLTSPDSVLFKWGGLLLESWEGAHHVKPILTLLTLLIFALLLSQLLKKSMRNPLVISRMWGEECTVLKDFGWGVAVWNSPTQSGSFAWKRVESCQAFRNPCLPRRICEGLTLKPVINLKARVCCFDHQIKD